MSNISSSSASTSCPTMSSATQQAANGQLIVLFQITTVDSCSPAAAGLSQSQIIGLAVGLVVIALLLVLVAVLLGVPSLRKKVFPFRDRAYHRRIKRTVGGHS